MFIEPSWFWNALPTRFQKCLPLLSTMLYAAQGLRPLPPFPDCCSFSICPPSAPPLARAPCWSRTRASPTPLGRGRLRSRNGPPEMAPPSRSGPGLDQSEDLTFFSVGHPQRRWERAGDVDLPELRLVLRHVVLQRVQEALHVLGAVDHPRPHDRLRRLWLHVDEVDHELRLVVVQHRHVDVHALRRLLVDLELDLHLRRCGGIVGGPARPLCPLGDEGPAIVAPRGSCHCPAGHCPTPRPPLAGPGAPPAPPPPPA